MRHVSIGRLTAALGATILAALGVFIVINWLSASKPAELSARSKETIDFGPPVLERGLITWARLDETTDVISGNVRNITNVPLHNVTARIWIHDSNIRTVDSALAQLDQSMLMPRQIGSYRAVVKHNPSATTCLVDFLVDHRPVADRDIRTHVK